MHHILLDRGSRSRRRSRLDPFGIVQELAGQPLDFRRHGGREEQRLAGEGQELADALDVGNEAHVEHPVGFVDHQELDAVQHELAAFEVIEEPARRGDDHIGAAIDLDRLVVKGDAADQQSHGQAVIAPERLEMSLNLSGKFACRLEDECPRHACPRPAFLQKRQHGQNKSGGLARSGLGKAEHVPALDGGRDGAGLDGGGDGETCGGHRVEDFGAQTER